MIAQGQQLGLKDIPSFDDGAKVGPFRRLYAYHHSRRFEWLRNKIGALAEGSVSILELGCHDARSLSYVPVHVHRYLGFDACWKSGWKDGKPYGMEAAQLRFRDRPEFEFIQSEKHDDLLAVSETFDIVIVCETFEYLNPDLLDAYVAALAARLDSRGYLLSTMPNEKGLPLLFKTAGSRFSGVRRSEYTGRQLWSAVRGRLDRVPRALRGRRGFDYSKMAGLIRRHFSQMKVESIASPSLPIWLSPNVGLIAKK